MIDKDLAAFQQLAQRLLQAEDENPVVRPVPPAEVMDKLQLELDEKGLDEASWQAQLEELMLHTPRTATRGFFNQLFGGRHGKAVVGELLSVLLNNSMYTYKAGGPMIGVEKELLRQSARLVGYDPSQAQGMMAPGGSMTNLMALLMARDAYQESIPQEGVNRKMTLYTSTESHYSVPKNAAFAGVGRQQLRYIPTNHRGEMEVAALQQQIKKDRAEGFAPFLINATAGTTVLGAFDPLNELADVAEAENMWLHVDGAYCGAVIFSDKLRYLIKGAERADSFSYNAHKMLSVPLSASLIVTRHPRQLYDTFANDAEYLYQTDSEGWNPGKLSMQCGRRNDALKLWSLWKAMGREGLGEMVEHQFHLADVARNYVENNADYTLYSFAPSVGICFNYKDIPAERLCNGLYEAGELMVGYGQFRDDVFVRLVTVNAGNSEADIHHFFQKLEAYAEKELLAPH